MIEVCCIRGAGGKELSAIQSQFLTSNEMAVRRGTYEIDKQWFLQHIQSIEVIPRKTDSQKAILDNDIVEISEARFGIIGRRRVRKVSLEGTPSDVVMKLELVKFEVFL